MKKKALALVLCAAMVCVMLSGCMRVELNTVINSDSTGEVTTGVFINKQYLDEMTSAFSDGSNSSDSEILGNGEGGITKVIDGVTYVGEYETKKFKSLKELQELLQVDPNAGLEDAMVIGEASSGEPQLINNMVVNKSYDSNSQEHIVISFDVVDLDTYAKMMSVSDETVSFESDISAEEMTEMYKVTMQFTFPGDIIKLEGPQGTYTSNGKTVNIEIKPSEKVGYYYIDALMNHKVDAKLPQAHFHLINTYNNRFKDVPSNAWYAEAVADAYEYGIVGGKTDTVFDPTGNMSIAEAITLAARICNIYEDTNSMFDALQGDRWYTPFVRYAVEHGIITDGEFEGQYNNPATRSQMAHIFVAALPSDTYTDITGKSYISDMKTSEQYYKDVLTLYKAGIVQGSGENGEFKPNNSITRAEAVAIISRLINTESRVGK